MRGWFTELTVVSIGKAIQTTRYISILTLISERLFNSIIFPNFFTLSIEAFGSISVEL